MIKYITSILILLFMLGPNTVEGEEQKKLFVRVYDLNGKKINNGKVIAATDSELLLLKNDQQTKVNVLDIGYIKTQHSAARNVFIGAAICGFIMGILSLSAGAGDTGFFGPPPIVYLGFGFAVGIPIGSLVGALTIPLRDSRRFTILGEHEKWIEFVNSIPVQLNAPPLILNDKNLPENDIHNRGGLPKKLNR